MPGNDQTGSRILVVEDEYYLADDLRALIGRTGADVLGPVPTADQARSLIEGAERVDAVLLDINLRGSTAYELADQLRASDVPFAFVTGYDRSVLPARFADTPTVHKPMNAEKLDALLATLLPATVTAAR